MQLYFLGVWVQKVLFYSHAWRTARFKFIYHASITLGFVCF